MRKKIRNKWLLRKASGSRNDFNYKPDYAETRSSKKNNYEIQRESMKKHGRTSLDTGLVKRWLFSQVGKDFDLVYSEFLSRIQPKYLESYRDCIYWYVEKKEYVEIKDNGEVWGKDCYDHAKPCRLPNSKHSTFYVDPETNELRKFNKKWQRDLNTKEWEELRKKQDGR